MNEEKNQNENANNKMSNEAIILLLLMMAFATPNTNNSLMEKELSYLHGKIDTLEKVVIS